MNVSTFKPTERYHKLFHRNMVALMAFNEPSSKLKSCFTEGMFLRPNKEGFFNVSHFLMNVIYPGNNIFKKCWPILDKAQERAFMVALIELIRALNDDFGDIYQISNFVPGRLMSPGGERFVKIMWEISVFALGVQAKRESGGEGCFFFHKPPERMQPNFRVKTLLLWKKYAYAALKECEAKLNELKEILRSYQEMKVQISDRMLARDKRIREVESNAIKLFKSLDLGDSLLSKLLDLSNEEGISELEKKLCDTSMFDMQQHWEGISALTKNTRGILEAVIKEESDGHHLVLDKSIITLYDATLDSSEHLRIANAYSLGVPLLDYVNALYGKLKILKPAIEANHLSECLKTWESICKEKELMDSELSKMESQLELVMSEFCSRSRDSTTGSPEHDGQFLRIIVSSAVGTSTPITSTPLKNKIFTSFYGGLNISVGISPHQPATSRDFFSVKLAEAHREIEDEKAKKMQQEANSLRSHNSSIDEIVDRLRIILQMREQRSSARVKND